jgi:precorrin-2/cobalt-factor-2 C20-methyltransferase
MTVKGTRLLQQVSVVAFPMGVGNQPGIAQTIISPWLTSKQETCTLPFPYVQNEPELRFAWKKAEYKSGITFNKERMWLLPVKGISASIVPLSI